MKLTRREFVDLIARGGLAVGGLSLVNRFAFLDLLAEDAADPHPFQVDSLDYAPEPGRRLSRLGFGMMRLPTKANGEIDEELADPMIDYAYRHGVNYFDTAWMYIGGKSQYYTGKVLEKYDRKSLFIVNKMPGNHGADNLERAQKTFATQLEACRTGYFDNYLCHAIGNWGDFEQKYLKGGVLKYLLDEREKGRIRHLGFSFHGGKEDLAKFLQVKEAGWEFVMLQLNADDIRGGAKDFYDLVRGAGLPIMVMEPLHGGRLANLNVAAREKLAERIPEISPAGWALRFVSSLPGVQVAISGMSRIKDVIDNVNTYRDFQPLSEADSAFYYDVMAKYQGKNLLPCTGCEYCIPCERGVNIPGVFGLVNTFRIEGRLGPEGDGKGMTAADRKEFLVAYQNRVVRKHADPTRCTACGKCSPKCPQHIEVAKELAKITQLVANIKKGKL